MKRNIILAITMMALVACASTPAKKAVYEEAAEVGSPGYMVGTADNGNYAVVYTGAQGMSRSQFAQYALLRAAEFTTESGYDWFAIITKRNYDVKLKNNNGDLQSRVGGSLDTGPSSSTGAGGAGGSSTPRGTSDASVGGGPTTGGFGGGDVPYQVLERWQAPVVPQTVIVIKMGSGGKASFEGLDKVPDIFQAKSVAADIRSKMPQ